MSDSASVVVHCDEDTFDPDPSLCSATGGPGMPVCEGDPSRLSPAQKRAYALEFASQRHGNKCRYAREIGITIKTLRTWGGALTEGDLDNGLIPRQGRAMTHSDVAEVTRLNQRIQELEAALEQHKRQSDTELKHAHKEITHAQREIKQLKAKGKDKDRQIAEQNLQIKAHAQQRELDQDQIKKLNQACDVLGKAISVVQNFSAGNAQQ